MPDTTEPATTNNKFLDLSGTADFKSDNPYDALIQIASDDPGKIQTRYETHREARNAQQRAKLLDKSFPGVTIDQILRRLEDATVEPGYVDPRHCLVFWARPPEKIRGLVGEIQRRLRGIAPNLWLMPTDHAHMTALEITHSRTAGEISDLVDIISPMVAEITNYTLQNRARVVKPMLGYDDAALALSFVPANGERLHDGRTAADDAFTYHHLRRDLYNLCKKAGATVESRYTVPSSHITVGRFITTKDHASEGGSSEPEPAKMRRWIEKIEEINQWLQEEYWPKDGEGTIKAGGEWVVGEEKGLDCRFGTVWYGGGETLQLGKGF